VQTTNRVRDDGRGGIGHAATLPFPSPVIRRVRGLARRIRPKFVFPVGSRFRVRVSLSPRLVERSMRISSRSALLFASPPSASLERLSALVEPLGSH
jgi:hypothetical protein